MTSFNFLFKKVFFTAAMCLIAYITQAQILAPPTSSDPEPFLPCITGYNQSFTEEPSEYNQKMMTCTQKFVAVNFHFVQKDDGTGNFSATSDGYGNTDYNGYIRAQEIIDKANWRWDNNMRNWRSPAGTPTLPTGIQLVLKGVYFHNSSDYAHTDNLSEQANFAIHNEYGVNPTTEVNIYMLPTAWSSSVGGVATCAFNCSVGQIATKINNDWVNYGNYPLGALNSVSRLLNHELGHLFGLQHTWVHNNAPTYYDRCVDTEPSNNCWGFSPNNPNCDEWSECSNNLMDYNHFEPALSPCQIGRMDNQLNGLLNSYLAGCDGCDPISIFTDMPSSVDACQGAMADVWLQGTASYGETSYKLTVNRVQGNTQYFSKTFSGELGLVNLRTHLDNYSFNAGYNYRLKIELMNDCGNYESEYKYIFINGEPSYPTSFLITGPLHVCAGTPEVYTTANDPSVNYDWSVSPSNTGYQVNGNQLTLYPFGNEDGYEICLDVNTDCGSYSVCRHVIDDTDIPHHCGSDFGKRLAGDKETISSMTLYPNPAKTRLSISIPNEIDLGETFSIQITDIQGSVIMEEQHSSHTFEINVEPLESNIYFVKIITGNELLVNKFVISK